MKASTLYDALREAKRFTDRAQRLLSLCDGTIKDHDIYNHPKESGAVKRASMDLTRALADLRKGR